MKEKQKTYQCIEHGEIFYIDAKNMEQAIEFASIYGGSVIKEVKLKVDITLSNPIDNKYSFNDEEVNYNELLKIIEDEITTNLLFSNSSIKWVYIKEVK